MAKALDNDNRHPVARFLYGRIAGLVSQSPGTPGVGTRQRREAEEDLGIPGTTRTRIGAENMHDGLHDDRARRMPPEIAELLIPIREDSTRCVWTVINAARKRDLRAERHVSDDYVRRARDDERQPLCLALPLDPLLLRDRDTKEMDSSTWKRAYSTRGLYARQFGTPYGSPGRDQVFVLRQADLLEHHNAVVSRTSRLLGVDPPARVLAGSPRRRLAKALLWHCCLADAARLRGLGMRR